MKVTNIICIEELCFLNCTLSFHKPVLISVFVSGFISSVAAAVITSSVCLVMQKKRRPKEVVSITASPGLANDGITEINQRKVIFELTSNIAYATVKH